MSLARFDQNKGAQTAVGTKRPSSFLAPSQKTTALDTSEMRANVHANTRTK